MMIPSGIGRKCSNSNVDRDIFEKGFDKPLIEIRLLGVYGVFDLI